MTRRTFLHTAAVTTAGVVAAPRLLADAIAAPRPLFSQMGISATLDKAAALKAAGAQFLTEGVDRVLMPDKSDAEFSALVEKLRAAPLPVLACGGFIRPAHLRCVGADANHDQVLAWAATCFTRLKKIGGKFIVFGSGGARKLKDGWPVEKADEQFVALLKKMGPLAAASGVTVVVEQLREQECNYINRIAHGARLIRAAGHPHIRLLADLYHMACMGDTPEDLAAAMDVVAHHEIAEKKNRTIPGVDGDDFRPFFKVLRKHGYAGVISVEGRWEPDQVAPAFKEMARQAAEV
jgi:sugar phosphate isomerase/epimerase